MPRLERREAERSKKLLLKRENWNEFETFSSDKKNSIGKKEKL